MIRGRAERRRLTYKKITQRIREWREIWPEYDLPRKPHFYAKRAVFGCNRPKCFYCHAYRTGNPKKYDDHYYRAVGEEVEDSF